MRITNVFKSWLGKKHSYDLEESQEMLQKIQDFIGVMDEYNLPKQAQLLRKSMESMKTHHSSHTPSNPPPKPLYIPTGKSVVLSEVNPLEIARQLTLIEFELMSNIVPKECLNQNWNKKKQRNTFSQHYQNDP